MALPIQTNVELPLLKVISDGGGELSMLKAVELVTAYFKEITTEDLAATMDSGINKWRNWVQWARQKLIAKEELDGSTRGIWKIKDKGKARLDAEWASWTPRYSRMEVSSSSSLGPDTSQSHQMKTTELNPLEKIEISRKEIVETISEEILAILLKLEPNLFENLIGVLLLNMGYGSIKITGRSGDGGIDGECSIDQLGLYKIHFQAKRWLNSSVPSKEIRDLLGAIQTQRGEYGIFITTSTFSKDALETAKKSGKIKAIDGKQLVALMIKYGLGIKSIPLSIPKIDYDFFEGFGV
ncbi:MAG: mrr restriction system protein, restriction system protein [archaeon GW2011_AR10]|uniref:Restriction endonuclease n=1 Tax=Candidatus Iainarchaeum sp. TaxID=3101447 RepID=A0A7J4IRQ6_9ARCH|nr:MAG: mrr restriction system protein, restriction system protein [archaeon GW2011_AR10]HIH08122.1 hypothetical protein [Candidatus Diapherotrites archaeon]